MAKGNAIVMYLEQARIHGEPIGVTHSEVLFTKPNGYTVQPHNRVVSKADNKTMGESFLNELIYVLGAEDGEERKLPYDREVLVYTSDEINSDNYRTYINESVWRMSNIQRILESSMGGCKPQLRLEMRKLFFARCQQLVDEIDEAMNKAVFMNPASKPSRISLAMAMLRGSILDSDPVTAVTIRNNFDSIVEDVTAIAGDAIKPLVMQLAPNEGEAKTAEAAYLYHNTEVLLREYSRIVNPSVADENRSLRILAQGGNTLESDARCHQAQVLVQYAQLIRGAIELVKDFPGDSKLYDVLMLVVNEKYGANGTDEAKLAEQVGINSSYFSEKKHRAFTALSALLWGCDIESLLSLLQ